MPFGSLKPLKQTIRVRLHSSLTQPRGTTLKEHLDTDASDLTWWYWLTSVRGLGPAYTRALLDAFGDPLKVFHATREELAQAVRLQSRTLDALESSKERLARYRDVAGRQSRLASAMDARILTLNDPDYPQFLRCQVKQAPAVIHTQGNLGLVRPQAVAVVGTRSPSTEAVERVRAFSTRLCESGSPVVAGMAKGVDAAAHSGALDSCGMTIGVLGCGLDRVYPPENSHLYAETRKRGLLISQFPFGSAPSPANLRQRNKLIVALSLAVVIAESDIQGGAMIAARAAVEQERNLFALRWPDMDSSARAGTRRLLESNLARAADEPGGESLFDMRVLGAHGAPPSKAWAAAFPEFQRKRGRRTERSGSSNGTSKKTSRSRRRTADVGQPAVAKRA